MCNILLGLLVFYAAGILVDAKIVVSHPLDRRLNQIALLDPIMNEEQKSNDDSCNRTVHRRPPDFSKTTRVSERQCEIYKSEMYYRDELERNEEQCIVSRDGNDDGVIGGRDALLGEFPHMGAVGWKADNGEWRFKCGGSLISANFLLTAAHCTRIADRDTSITIDENRVPKIVRLGQINIIEGSLGIPMVDVNIVNIYNHPSYHSPRKYNDIALFRLEIEVEFTKYIQPACLWTKFNTTSLGNEAIVTGWGDLNPNLPSASPVLQAATIDVLDSDTCDKFLNWCTIKFCRMQDNQLCAGKLSGGVDSCTGDSGGPLQVKISVPVTTQGTLSYVIGVTSFGNGCGFINTPGVYARVSTALDWIESIVWPLV